MKHQNELPGLLEAVLAYNVGNYEAARDIALSALESQPEESEYHKVLAKALNRLEQYDAALVAIDQCIALGLEDEEAINAKAIILIGCGQYAKAEKILQDFVATNPNDLISYGNLITDYNYLKSDKKVEQTAIKLSALASEVIKKHHKTNSFEEFEAYLERARARYFIADTKDAVILSDIENALRIYDFLSVVDQDIYDKEFLLNLREEL